MEATIDTLQIKVEADASDANKQLTRLTKRLGELQNFQKTTNINIKTGRSVSSIRTLYNALNELWTLLKKIRKNAYLKINTELIYKKASEPNTTNKKSKTTTTNPNELVNVPPVTGTTELPKIKKTFDFSKLKDTFEAVKNSKVFDKLGEFTKSIKRIALYRIIRSIVKTIEDAIKEGTKNLYNYSQAIGSQFSKSLDTITTSLSYMKNAFITVFEPVINAITPFIEKVVDSIAEIFNKLSMVINKALGNDYYTRAIKVAKKYNAEIKKTILSFDELNKMNGEDNDPLLEFETVELATEDAEEMEQITSRIQKIINGIVSVIGGTAIGKALLNIGKVLTQLGRAAPAISTILEGASGAAASIFGVFSYITSYIEQGKAGALTDEVLIETLKGELGVIAGGALLGAAFGNPLIGAAIGVIVAGAGNIVTALIDAISNKVTWKNALLSVTSFTAIGTMIGTLISPGLGTAIGAGLGLIVGEITHYIILISQKWDSDIVPIFNSIVDWFKQIPTTVQTAFDSVIDWFSNFGENIFKLNDDILNAIHNALSTIGKEIETFFSSPIENIGNLFISVINFCIGGVEDMLNMMINGLNTIISAVNSIGIVKIDEIATVKFDKIPQLANGGMIDAGQLFIANENGAEFISSYNGKTAVANNEQMIRGITEGVRDAFRESDFGGNWTIQIVDESGTIKSETIISALERKNRRDGKTIVAVGV